MHTDSKAGGQRSVASLAAASSTIKLPIATKKIGGNEVSTNRSMNFVILESVRGAIERAP
jgi:hypothetical protein